MRLDDFFETEDNINRKHNRDFVDYGTEKLASENAPYTSLHSEKTDDTVTSMDILNNADDFIQPIQKQSLDLPPVTEFDKFSSMDKTLAVLRAREIKKIINELEKRIAEERQNLADDEEWVMTPELPSICRNEITKDINNYKINIAFLEKQLQKSLDQLREIETLLGDNNARFR